MKLNIELYLKVDFVGKGAALNEAYNRKRKTNTYGSSRLLDVLESTTTTTTYRFIWHFIAICQ